MGALLSIGIVANKAGVTPDTIRYYERLGLLPPPTRTRAGYRQYGDGVVNRLSLIRNAAIRILPPPHRIVPQRP